MPNAERARCSLSARLSFGSTSRPRIRFANSFMFRSGVDVGFVIGVLGRVRTRLRLSLRSELKRVGGYVLE